MNTLSDKFMIRAIDCIMSPSITVLQKPTAAGLPPNGLLLKTLTCQTSSSVIAYPERGGSLSLMFDCLRPGASASCFDRNAKRQVQWAFARRKTSVKVERDRSRAIIIKVLQARCGLGPRRCRVPGYPPHRIGRPARLAEPLVAIREGISVEASIYERVDRVDVGPKRECGRPRVGRDHSTAVIEPGHGEPAPLSPITLKVGKMRFIVGFLCSSNEP